MLSIVPKSYLVAAGVLLAVGALLLAGYGGYAFSDARWTAKWAVMEKEAADALALLAQRDVAADAEAIGVRAAAEAVVAQRVEVVRREIVKIPVRTGCGHSDDEYRVLLDTYCVRYPDAPQCMYHPMPKAAPAPESGGQPRTD